MGIKFINTMSPKQSQMPVYFNILPALALVQDEHFDYIYFSWLFFCLAIKI